MMDVMVNVNSNRWRNVGKTNGPTFTSKGWRKHQKPQADSHGIWHKALHGY